MSQINEMIISEINGSSNISEKMKGFLKWILEFERDNIDKELYSYKQEIDKKIDEFLIDNSGNKNA